MTIPVFSTKEARIKWVIENKASLIAQKKASIKLADAFSFAPLVGSEIPELTETTKGLGTATISENAKKIKVRSIINTTKILDGHGDVHIDQLWNKSLKETKDHYLVNQHNFTFEGIISDDVKAFVKQMTWKELGYDYPGNTQALIYDSVISKDESPQMFEMYRKGKIKQHSVGMRYVKIDLAVNDEGYEKEYEVWNKYFPQIVNGAEAEEQGYFFAVTEAKNIEGSAVVKGSNFATPTYSIEEKSQPPSGTESEPVQPLKQLDVNELLNHYNI